MDLVVYADQPLKVKLAGRPLRWDVTGSVALGSSKALSTLAHLLCRDHLHDVVLFKADASTGCPIADSPLDPALSAYEQGLAKGSSVYATVNPDALFTDPTRAFWVPLSTATLRFSGDFCSERNLRLVGTNRRRVLKTGPDSWDSSVVMCETSLSNEGVSRWTFRVTTESLQALSGAGKSSSQPQGKAPRSEDALGSTMYSRTGAEKPSRHTSSNRSVRFAGDGHNDRRDYEDDEEEGDDDDGEDSTEEPGQAAPSLPDEFEGGVSCPVAAIGVADENVPLNSQRVHATYPRSYMLHTSTGAFYSGGDSRPLFADAHTYRCVPGMIITMAVDTDRGLLNIFCNGRNVLTASVPRHMALYPVVELFSHGTIVDIM